MGVSSNPLKEWGNGLLVLGAIVAVFSVAFFFAHFVLEAVTPRTYGFADPAVRAGGLAVLLLALGGGLRVLEIATSRRPQSPAIRPR